MGLAERLILAGAVNFSGIRSRKSKPITDEQKARSKALAKARKEQLRQENLEAARIVMRHREAAKKNNEDRGLLFDLHDEGLHAGNTMELWQYQNLPRAERRAKQQQLATPRWVDRERLKAIYRLRDEMNQESPEMQYEVDHIIPILHDLVCGLHVPENLQILPKRENFIKGSKFEVS